MFNPFKFIISMPKGDRNLLIIAVLGMSALSAWFLTSSSHVWPTDRIGSISTTGPIKRRPSRSLEWGTIKNEGTIFLRDTVFIPPNIRSTVTFSNGTVLRLEPNTMVLFDEVNLKRMDVVLLKGNVVVVKNPKKPLVRENEKTEDKERVPSFELPSGSYSLNMPKGQLQRLPTPQTPAAKTLVQKKVNPIKTVFQQYVNRDTSSVAIPTTPFPTSQQPTIHEPVAMKPVIIQPQQQPVTSISQPVQLSFRSEKVSLPTMKMAPPKVFKLRSNTVKETLQKSPMDQESFTPNTMNLIQPLQEPSELIRTHADIEFKNRRYKNKLFTLLPLEPLSLDPKQYNLNEIIEFQIEPASPLKNELVLSENHCIQLIWTPVSIVGVSYYLEISRDSQFRYVRSYGTETNFISLLLNDNSEEYFWRVRAVKEEDSLVSNLTSFRTKKENTTEKLKQREKSYFPEWEVCNLN